jgi:hypothetical protein
MTLSITLVNTVLRIYFLNFQVEVITTKSPGVSIISDRCYGGTYNGNTESTVLFFVSLWPWLAATTLH